MPPARGKRIESQNEEGKGSLKSDPHVESYRERTSGRGVIFVSLYPIKHCAWLEKEYGGRGRSGDNSGVQSIVTCSLEMVHRTLKTCFRERISTYGGKEKQEKEAKKILPCFMQS